MNIHHLELFYYVAKYEGITAAVRKMPYGIQQPAVSGQILQLEEKLGVKLFNRRPFALTAAGEELYDFCYPFFSRLRDVEERLRGDESLHLRLAASASTLRNHLPDVLETLRLEEPRLRLLLKEVDVSDFHQLLTSQQVDLAIGILSGKTTDALKAEPLVKLNLVLLVPSKIKVKTWKDLLEKDPYVAGAFRGKESLIGLPQHEMLQQLFLKELDDQKVDWPVAVEVNSMDVVREYVSRGFGVGIGLDIPGAELPPGVKKVPLKGFPPIVVGAMYQGKLKPLAERFLERAREHARRLA